MIRYASIFVFLVFFINSNFSYANLEDANKKFEKKLYQEALKEYSLLLKSANGSERQELLFKAAQCEVFLFKYAEAAQRVVAEKTPEDWNQARRFLIFKTELGREYLKQYGFAGRRDIEDGNKDVTKKSIVEWHREIQKSFEELWKQKEKLKRKSLKVDADIIDLVDSDLEKVPTFYDFVVERWTDYLTTQSDSQVVENATEMAQRIFTEASTACEPERELACELWQLQKTRLTLEADPKKNVDRYQQLFKSFKKARAKTEAGYQAAQLLSAQQNYADAVQMCDSVLKISEKTKGARDCQRLSAEIRAPVIGLQTFASPSPGMKSLKPNFRNVDTVYFKIYSTNPSDLKENSKPSDFSYIRYLSEEKMKRFLVTGHLVDSFEYKPVYKAPHAFFTQKIDTTKLENGLYVIIASNDAVPKPGTSMIAGSILNITDFYLFAGMGIESKPEDFTPNPTIKTLTRPIFQMYSISGKNGEPLPNVGIDYFQENKALKSSTDGNGQRHFEANIKLQYPAYNYINFDFLGEKDGHYAYSANGVYFNFNQEEPIQIFVDLDRPIYRPGQKVQVKAQAVQRVPGGYKTYGAARKIVISAMDSNGAEFFKKELQSNDFGSVATDFEIPKGRLLGNYQIQASLTDGDFARNFTGNSGFQVEEYKRPEFEVTVRPSVNSWVYGQKTQILGDVKYYFGGPVAKAKIRYKIYRQSYNPWFMWWLSSRFPSNDRREITSAALEANEKGEFKFDFTPEQEKSKEEFSANYTVEVEARDSGGRTLNSTRSFYAGKSEFNIALEVSRGFYNELQKFEVNGRLVDLNGQQKAGSAEFELFLLDDPNWNTEEEENTSPYVVVRYPNQVFNDAKTKSSIQKGTLKMSADKVTAINLQGIEEGFYRLEVRSKDSKGNLVKGFAIIPVFGNLQKISKMHLPAMTFIENSKLWVGEKANIVLGASELKGPVFLQIGQGQFITSQQTLAGSGFRRLEVAVTDQFVRGFSVNWFGVYDFKVFSGQVGIDVPAIDRKLQSELRLNSVMLPGSDQKWILSVQNANKSKATAEATVKIFDRSLEYYSSPSGSSLFDRLYFPFGAAFRGQLTQLMLNSSQVSITEGWISKMLGLFSLYQQDPRPPALKINRTRVNAYSFGRRAIGRLSKVREDSMSLEEDSAMDSIGAAPAAKMKSEIANSPSAAKGASSNSVAASEPVEVRSNMNETAYFNPQLLVQNGFAQIQFKAPDQLTSWKVAGTVLTKNGLVGDIAGTSVTRKDLMVRIEIPRFFREGDKGVIKAVIHNETDRPLRGTVDLKLTRDQKDSAASFNLKDLARTIEVPGHGLITLTWEITAPSLIDVFKVQAIARAGTFSDAEQREFPVLPSRQRLIENTMVALNGKSEKIMRVPKFDKTDSTRLNESLTLQVDPQLALSIINSIPFLVRYPHECTEQILNRYVPLAIINSFYGKYPQLAEAVRKIPKRKTISPAWEDNDPRRMMTMLESPWLDQSKGTTSVWPITDLFNPALVTLERDSSLKDIVERQLSSGGFPWFSGGREDLYITLYVLEGFAQAAQYGVPYPEDVVRKALNFAYNEIPKRLKPNEGELAFVLYASYVVTSFPKSLSYSAEGYRQAAVWMDFANRYSDAMTPLGKAQASMVFHRLGNVAKAESYLARALDGSQKDEISGVFWAPEKVSWLWYNDSVEKHAFFLKTLLEVKPKDERIPGLVQWLLFNRKGNEWKSTKASAAAIYSLLDVMKSKGALDKSDQFEVNWADQKENFIVEPFQWIEKPYRWSKGPSEIKATHGQVKISKTGPGVAFASMTWIYSTDEMPKASSSTMLQLQRKYFRRVKEGSDYHLKPIQSGDHVRVGEEIEVQLKINSKSQFEYVHLQDPRGAGFESEQLLSGWKWDLISRYEEPRDSVTNFFISWLPHGEYILKHQLRPTTPGQFKIGAAVLQSMYAPEMSAYSDGIKLVVDEN